MRLLSRSMIVFSARRHGAAGIYIGEKGQRKTIAAESVSANRDIASRDNAGSLPLPIDSSSRKTFDPTPTALLPRLWKRPQLLPADFGKAAIAVAASCPCLRIGMSPGFH